MKITDAHMHVGINGFNVENLIQYLDFHGIEKCWLLSWEESRPAIEYIYQHLGLEQILEAYQKYPDRIVPFYSPDPGDKHFEKKLGDAIDLGIKGCGELKVTYKWEDAAIGEYLDVVEKTGLPLVFHMELPRIQYIPDNAGFVNRVFERLLNDKFNGLSRHYLNQFLDQSGFFKKRLNTNRVSFPGYLFDFAFLEKRVQQFPGINFIAHGPDFWSAISSFKNPRHIHPKGKIGEFGIIDNLLETYDNFFCDISGLSGYNALTRDQNAGKVFLQKHASKLLFGTDNTHLGLLDYLTSLNISKSAMHSILYLNSEKLIPQVKKLSPSF